MFPAEDVGRRWLNHSTHFNVGTSRASWVGRVYPGFPWHLREGRSRPCGVFMSWRRKLSVEFKCGAVEQGCSEGRRNGAAGAGCYGIGNDDRFSVEVWWVGGAGVFAHPGRLQANGPRHRAEAVADHGVAINAHLAQCGIDVVFAHRPPMAAHARKEAFAAACQRVQVAEGRHGLRGQRDDVRGVGCGGGLAPFVQDRCQDGFGVFQLRRTLGACFGEGHGRVSAQPDHARLARVAIAPDA